MSITVKQLVLRYSVLPVVLAAASGLAIAWFAASRTQPQPTVPGTDAVESQGLGAIALVPWLHVPMAFAAVATLAMTVRAWPLFGRDRTGAIILRRLHPGFALGTFSATTAALSLLALVLAGVCALWFAGYPLRSTDGSPMAARSHVSLQAEIEPSAELPDFGDGLVAVLDDRNPTLRFSNASDARFIALRVAPWILPDFERPPPRIAIRTDGEASGAPVSVAPGDPPRVMPLTRKRSAAALALVWATPPQPNGTPSSPVLFPPGTIEGIGAKDFGVVWNTVLFAATWLLPVWAAMGLLALASTTLSLAASITVGTVIVFLLALSGLAPVGAAGDALARGRFIGTEGFLWRAIVPLTLGGLGFCLAELLDRRNRGHGPTTSHPSGANTMVASAPHPQTRPPRIDPSLP